MTEEERDQELSALLDDEHSTERQGMMRAEIASDPHLQERFDALRSIDAQLGGLEAPPLPEDLRARLDLKIRAAAHSPRTRPPVQWARPLAAALAAGLFVAWLLLPAAEPQAPSVANGDPLIAVIQEASDVELAIAFEIDTLRNLEVIEELELLEALLALEEGRS